MKSLLLVLLALFLGAAVGVWYGKQHASPVGGAISSSRPNHIKFVVEGNTKVDLAPVVGDIITWVDTSGNPVTVNVASYAGLDTLCTEANPTSKCTILADGGIFPYDCSTAGLCFDPGISPGKSPGGPGGITKASNPAMTTAAVKAQLSPIPESVQVACTPPTTGTATATPGMLNIDANTDVMWIGGPGATGYVTLPAGTCSNQGSKTQYAINIDGCEVLQSAVNYPIHLNGCPTDGTGTINLSTQRAK
jgi:hypothetical protein